MPELRKAVNVIMNECIKNKGDCDFCRLGNICRNKVPMDWQGKTIYKQKTMDDYYNQCKIQGTLRKDKKNDHKK